MLCYHRLLTHRGLACPKWLEYGFAILGVCSMQDTPARWVAVHRRHHEHADQREDPHSPLVGFFWGHVGWMLVENADLVRLSIYDRYSKDILRDRFYRRLERTYLYPTIIISSWAAFFVAGFAAGMLNGTGVAEAVRFSGSLLIWRVFVRAVLVWHITWLVTSGRYCNAFAWCADMTGLVQAPQLVFWRARTSKYGRCAPTDCLAGHRRGWIENGRWGQDQATWDDTISPQTVRRGATLTSDQTDRCCRPGRATTRTGSTGSMQQLDKNPEECLPNHEYYRSSA